MKTLSYMSALLLVLLSQAAGQQRVIDLTETIRPGMVRETLGDAMIEQYGIRDVTFTPEMTFQKTTGRSTHIGVGTQVGTHIDAGAHVEPDGWGVDEVRLESLIGPGVVVDVRSKSAADPVTPKDLEGLGISRGDAVLFLFTYTPPKPGELYSQSYLTDEAAQWLVARGVRCVGSNTPGLENFRRGVAQKWTDPANQAVAWPVHKTLLRAHIPIIEGLTNLDQLIGKQFQFIALPLKISGADGSPVRAIAVFE
jgi:arylformamidase